MKEATLTGDKANSYGSDMTTDSLTLSGLQQTQVWQNWLSSEMRANYFADFVSVYERRQFWLTVGTLVFSSAAFAGFISNALPQGMDWVTGLSAFLAAALSIVSLVQKNHEQIKKCSDLHFLWARRASEYEALWDDMYSTDAPDKLARLIEKDLELSRQSAEIPYREKRMARWQDHVQRHHGLAAPA